MPPTPVLASPPARLPASNAVTDTTTTGIAGGGRPGGKRSQCGHPADKLGDGSPPAVCASTCPGQLLSIADSYTRAGSAISSHLQFPTSSAAKFGPATRWASGWLMDGIYGNSRHGEIELTRAWGLDAAWEQVWNPKWKTSILQRLDRSDHTMTTPRR